MASLGHRVCSFQSTYMSNGACPEIDRLPAYFVGIPFISSTARTSIMTLRAWRWVPGNPRQSQSPHRGPWPRSRYSRQLVRASRQTDHRLSDACRRSHADGRPREVRMQRSASQELAVRPELFHMPHRLRHDLLSAQPRSGCATPSRQGKSIIDISFECFASTGRSNSARPDRQLPRIFLLVVGWLNARRPQLF